jgi:hypothetical protein
MICKVFYAQFMEERFADDDVRTAMRQAIELAGSLRRFAAEVGVSPTHVSLVLTRDLPPGPAIATALGFIEDGKRWVRPK